jgi:hypothetical protein
MHENKPMKSSTFTRQYRFHGLNIAVSATDLEIIEALDSRLGHFREDVKEASNIDLQFSGVSDPDHHLIKEPPGLGRPVYDPPDGQILYYDASDRLYLDYDNKVRMLCDPDEGKLRASVLLSATDGLWLACHPLFTIGLVEILKRRELYSIHAATLSIDGKGVLFPGNSGAGKSTLAIILLRAGFSFLGDDMVFVSNAGDKLHVMAFPEEIDASVDTLRVFPELSYMLDLAPFGERSKRQFQASDPYEVEFAPACMPAALVFPQVSQSDISLLKPISQDEAFLELAPNVLLTEVASSQRHFAILAQLAEECACFRLETGRDFEYIPDLVKDLIS